MERVKKPQPDAEIGQKSAEREQPANPEQMARLAPAEGEIREKEDQTGQGAGLDAVDQAGDQHRSDAQRAEPPAEDGPTAFPPGTGRPRPLQRSGAQVSGEINLDRGDAEKVTAAGEGDRDAALIVSRHAVGAVVLFLEGDTGRRGG